MKHCLLKAGVLLGSLAAVGLLIAVLGLVPIKASSGHWPITAWLLHFAMRQSVTTHTLGLQIPALDETSLVLKGAGHYETGCRLCHGSPDQRNLGVTQGMTPHPPYLPRRISAWGAEEIFYIVKHGVKFTGMPAWPTQQRDDEVWAMVAFLLRLPQLDAEAYRRLVHGENPVPDEVAPSHDLTRPEQISQAAATRCARCHGPNGGGRGAGAFPRLAGQRPAYAFAALQAFARGARHSGIMEPIAASLSLAEMQELAFYYENLQEPSPSFAHQDDAAAIARGAAIAQRGIPSQRVPSCVDCHGPGATRRNPAYPLLAGQYADYLVLQLELFKKEQRGGSAYAHLMRPVAANLTSEQIRDVALYYASLTPIAHNQMQ